MAPWFCRPQILVWPLGSRGESSFCCFHTPVAVSRSEATCSVSKRHPNIIQKKTNNLLDKYAKLPISGDFNTDCTIASVVSALYFIFRHLAFLFMSLRFSSQPINKLTPCQGGTVDSVHFVIFHLLFCEINFTEKKISFTSEYISLLLTLFFLFSFN